MNPKESRLRKEIANYLFQSRGIHCKPEQIVISSGTELLLPMILRLFEDDFIFALENPGYSAIPRIHLNNNAIPISVDEEGLVVDELEKTNANIVYITPSHQFPTGAVLSATRRTQLLKWASKDLIDILLKMIMIVSFATLANPFQPCMVWIKMIK